jgi:hypothetical protein
MQLFDEYAASFARGERPDLRDYLARAGDQQAELATLVDAWLSRLEPPAPDEEHVALAEAWIAGQAPLTELRARRGLSPGDVVDALIKHFDLDQSKRNKVQRYYKAVETGQLVPADQRLLAALAEILRTRISDLLALRPRPSSAEPLELRTAPAMTAKLSPPIPSPEDEIDRLFRTAEGWRDR